jgi:hypothetical protein
MGQFFVVSVFVLLTLRLSSVDSTVQITTVMVISAAFVLQALRELTTAVKALLAVTLARNEAPPIINNSGKTGKRNPK